MSLRWTTLNLLHIRRLMENLITVGCIHVVEFSNSDSALFNSILSSLMRQYFSFTAFEDSFGITVS